MFLLSGFLGFGGDGFKGSRVVSLFCFFGSSISSTLSGVWIRTHSHFLQILCRTAKYTRRRDPRRMSTARSPVGRCMVCNNGFFQSNRLNDHPHHTLLSCILVYRHNCTRDTQRHQEHVLYQICLDSSSMPIPSVPVLCMVHTRFY